MRGVIFVPSVADTQWLAEVLQGHSLVELPIAARPIVEYGIEVAMRRGFEVCEILDWRYSRQLAQKYAELTTGTLPVFYHNFAGPMLKGLIDLVRLSTPLTQNIEDNISVVWGLSLPTEPEGDGELEPLKPGESADTPCGVYRRVDGRWMRVRHNEQLIRSPSDWLAANIDALHSPEKWTLPGYSAEKDVHLGRNVVLEHGTDVKPPVLLQDNSWCARNVALDGDVIVGSGSVIGEGARLKRTVVCNDTYIGAGLELVDKIVIGRRIIDAETGVYTDIEEPGVARGLAGGVNFLRKLLSFIHGKSRGRGRAA